jgi:hypothetical protein
MLQTSARRPGVRSLGWMVASALLATGCSQHDSADSPKPTPTSLTSLNSTAMQIPRIEFCKLIPETAVRIALGGKPDSSASYGNGDEVDVPGVGREVVHEIGCTWSTDEGAAARAWVFALPVDADFARQAIDSSRDTQGCRVVQGPEYGEPSVTQICRQSGGSTRVRHAGLFGQTWLSCEVTDPADDAAAVRTRADSWCVEVANALNTGG